MFVTEIIIFCTPLARQVPINYILLSLFTLCMSYVTCLICAKYNANLILTAAILTTTVTVSTIYAFTTETDFT